MITLTREEAQQVLDALEDAADHIGCPDDDDAIGVARRTLRTRLAQPEPEPVAWTYDSFNWENWGEGSWQITVSQRKEREDQQPLYTAPPQRVYCLCGDGIVADDGALCGTCVAAMNAVKQEPVAWHEPGSYSNVTVYKKWAEENKWLPLYKEKNT